MSDTSAVSVAITADVSGLTAGLKAASTATTVAAQDMKASLTLVSSSSTIAAKSVDILKASAAASVAPLAQASGGAQEAAKSFSSFGDKILETGSRMRSQGRFASFITRDIGQLGAVSMVTAGELGGLVSAIAYGSAFGIAAASVRLIVTAFQSAGSEAKKLQAASSEAMAKIRAETDAAVIAINGQTAAQKAFADMFAPEATKEFELRAQLRAATTAQVIADQQLQYANDSGNQEAIQGLALTAEARKKEVDGLLKQLDAQKKLTDAAGKGVGEVSTADTKKTKLDVGEQERQSAEENKIKLLQIASELADGEWKIDAENAVKIEQIEAASATRIAAIRKEADSKHGENAKIYAAQIAKTQAESDALVAAQSEVYVRDALKFRNDAEAQLNADIQTWRNKNIALEASAAEKIKKLWQEQDQQRATIAEKRSASDEKELRERLAAAQAISSAFGAALAGIATGNATALQGLAALSKAVVDVAVHAIEAYAASAAAAAFFSQAGIPIIGPILAVAAAATAGAFVDGLLSKVPGAAVGADIPTGVNPILQAHGGEIVLPKPSSAVLRSLPAAVDALSSGSGPGGGGDTHNWNIYANDAQSFEQYLGRADVQRGISNLVRTGRWRG